MENKGETRQEGTGVPRPIYSLEVFAALIEQRPHNPQADPDYGYLTEGKDLVSAFTELVREAKAVRYKMFDHVLLKVPSSPHTTRESFGVERMGFRSAIGDPHGHKYGRTYARAMRELVRWVPIIPRPESGPSYTSEPVNDHSLIGFPEGAYIQPTVFDGPLLERWQRWVADFEIEVDVCAKRFIGDKDLGAELEGLKVEVKRFEVGTAEGDTVRASIKKRAAGKELLGIMATGKKLVLRMLGDKVEEYAPKDNAGERITWGGRVGELAELFHELERNGWIVQPPKGRASLARLIHGHFRDANGTPFALDTLVKNMQPKAHRPLRDGVRFEISSTPRNGE